MTTAIEEMIIREAKIARWWVHDRRQSKGGSVYLDLRHPVKKGITVRLSDHKCVGREGQKLINIVGESGEGIDNLLKFLAKGKIAFQAACRG